MIFIPTAGVLCLNSLAIAEMVPGLTAAEAEGLHAQTLEETGTGRGGLWGPRDALTAR